MARFYTRALARRLNVTPTETFDALQEQVRGRADLAVRYAHAEISDMAIAARALIGRPELERAFVRSEEERP